MTATATRQTGPSVPTNEQVWDWAVARLDRPIEEGLNTAHETCDRWARDRSRIAIIVTHADGSSQRWTYADLSEASSRMAAAFVASGLKRGDRVAALVSRQVEATIGALAAWRAGMVYMPLFVGFGPDAMSQRINAAEAAAVVVDHQFREALEVALPLVINDLRVFTVAGRAGRGIRRGDLSFWAEHDRFGPSFDLVQTASSDLATLMFTSGTTGPPKGCMMPHHLQVTVSPFIQHVMALSASDLLFAGADPGWSYGLHTTGFNVMAFGLPRVIYTGDFTPAAWLDVMQRERVTYAAGAPSAFRKVAALAAREGLPPTLRGATCAGEPLDAPLAAAWGQLGGGELQDGYGQTELGMALGNLAADPRPIVPGSLASTVPGFDMVLMDDNGNEVEGEGIIAMRRTRFQASTGYWNADDLWAKRWYGDLFSTGDRARRDPDGRWWFTGRADDLIVTSGYNVGPTEVETIVLEHPGVADAAVVGAPDPDRGTVVRAVVVADGTVPCEEITRGIQDSVKTRLGRHAYPRIVDFVDELPRTESGKIRRVDLRAGT